MVQKKRLEIGWNFGWNQLCQTGDTDHQLCQQGIPTNSCAHGGHLQTCPYKWETAAKPTASLTWGGLLQHHAQLGLVGGLAGSSSQGSRRGHWAWARSDGGPSRGLVSRSEALQQLQGSFCPGSAGGEGALGDGNEGNMWDDRTDI